MDLQTLYGNVIALFQEEAMLLRKADLSLPEGKICYKLTTRSYEKADGTVSRYFYRRTYYSAEGKQMYLNKKEAVKVSGILTARDRLGRIQAELVSLVAEINRRQPQKLTLPGLRELFEKNEKILAALREQSKGFKREIEYPCIAADGTVMRSRNEVIVANLLISVGLPYVYEPIFRTPTGRYPYRRPDFCVLTPNGIVYIEVMGMCNDKNYWTEQQEKLEEYRKSGLQIGKNLLVIEIKEERRVNSQIIYEALRNLLIGVVSKDVIAV